MEHAPVLVYGISWEGWARPSDNPLWLLLTKHMRGRDDGSFPVPATAGHRASQGDGFHPDPTHREINKIVDRSVGDAEAALWLRDYKAHGCKLGQCLAHRTARSAIGGAEFLLTELASGHQSAV